MTGLVTAESLRQTQLRMKLLPDGSVRLEIGGCDVEVLQKREAVLTGRVIPRRVAHPTVKSSMAWADSRTLRPQVSASPSRPTLPRLIYEHEKSLDTPFALNGTRNNVESSKAKYN